MADNNPTHQICGAKTRSGAPCRNPPVRGKKRCRMHGGAKGSGAPLGNRNALKHGLYAQEEKQKRSEVFQLNKILRELTAELNNI